MNLNDLAHRVTLSEGKLQSVSIAQVKEIIKIIAIECYENSEVIELLIKNGKKHA